MLTSRGYPLVADNEGDKVQAVNDAVQAINDDVDALVLVSDHGALTGLADDDHPQYHNDTRGDLRYSQLGHNHDDLYMNLSQAEVDLSGGNVALTSTQAQKRVIKAIGTLTADRTITVPDGWRDFHVWNATGGNFDLYIKSASEGTGQKIPAPRILGIFQFGTFVLPVADSTREGSTIEHTANGFARPGDEFQFINATAGNITVTLPDATDWNGLCFTFKRVDSSGNTVTISGAQNIDGSASASLASQYDTLRIVSNGAVWLIV